MRAHHHQGKPSLAQLARSGWQRLASSSVAWTWVMNGFRLGSGLLLLPLLLRVLPKNDLGMYYIFLNLAALVPIVDFGFSVSVSRYVSYAMGGARELKAQGLVPIEKPGPPNMELLWRLLQTTRQLFRRLSVLTLVLLGVGGTWTVSRGVQDTAHPTQTWLAWGLMLVAGVLEVYAGWWTVFLRGMNDVLQSARIAVAAYATRLGLAALLLLLGAGLMAIPLAALAGSLLQREWSRRRCLRLLGVSPPPGGDRPESLLGILWPNSWRVGVQLLSSWAVSYASVLICMEMFGLAVNAQYGLSLQLTQFLASMSAVWLAVKWPVVGQYQTRKDLPGLREVLWPRFWLQNLTYLGLALPALLLGPTLLRWLGTRKELLPPEWMALLLLAGFLDMQFSFWTTLLSMENRIPSLWPTVATNVLTLGLVVALVLLTPLGTGALVLAPFLSNSLFSYWYWPLAGAQSLGTRFLDFVFRPVRPGHA